MALSADDARTFIRSHHNGVLATIRRDGAPQLSPVTVGVDAYYRDVQHLQDEGQFGNALIFSAFNYAKVWKMF